MSNDAMEEAGFVHVDTGEIRSQDLSSGTYVKPLKNKIIAKTPARLRKFCDDLSIGIIKAYRAADGQADRILKGEIAKGPAGRVMAAIGHPEDPGMSSQMSR